MILTRGWESGIFFSLSCLLLSGFSWGCDTDSAKEGETEGKGADTDTDREGETDSRNDTALSSDGDAADASSILRGSCPLDEKIGVFEIAHYEMYSAVTGVVADGVNPLTVPQEEESEGDCKLMRKVNPFCDPTCTSGDVCDHDGRCVPFPVNQNIGQVEVSGLKKAVSLMPNEVGDYQETELDDPPFEADAPIRLEASGGDFDPFTLYGFGVQALEMEDPKWVMESGKPLTINWVPAEGPGSILATFNIDQHGNSPVTMFCEFEDTGEGTLPAKLVDKLMEYGMSGYANGNIYRHTVDSVEMELGCVELDVFSHLEAQLSIKGFTPGP